MGDNIYSDTEDPEVLVEQYGIQKSHKTYQEFISKVPVIGIWDDHDYGVNNGGKEYPIRWESQQAMMDFLDVPQDDRRRKEPGAYASYEYGSPEKKVKIILLDARYFRDPVNIENRTIIPNYDGTILGKEQWSWLENELNDPEVDVLILACGIQIIPQDHSFEKWANFPNERKKLLDVLKKYHHKRVLILSGDRHIAEFSKYTDDKLEVLELTSSGMTHSYDRFTSEKNRWRIGEVVSDKNFGSLNLHWEKSYCRVRLNIHAINGQVIQHQVFEIPYKGH